MSAAERQDWVWRVIEEYVSVTPVVGAASGREQDCQLQFAARGRSYEGRAYMIFD